MDRDSGPEGKVLDGGSSEETQEVPLLWLLLLQPPIASFFYAGFLYCLVHLAENGYPQRLWVFISLLLKGPAQNERDTVSSDSAFPSLAQFRSPIGRRVGCRA